MDWIQGDKFIGLADYTFAPPKRRNDDYDHLPNTLVASKLKDRDVIYTHTIYIKELFETIAGIDKKLIVISHNGDVNIDFSPPDNVIMWYTQNVNIIHDRVKSIPIGLENDRWFSDVHKKEKMMAKLQQPRNTRNLVYMNYNIATNPAKREKVYHLLKNKDWVTCDMRANGQDFDNYLDNIYNHKFVICPEGNGIDTHRVWECLYMGTIPITEDNITRDLLYSYFPTATLPWEWGCSDNWRDLTKDYLENEFRQIEEIKSYFDGVRSLLTFEYWKNKILNNGNI